jgi:hypothetical protein
MEHQWNEIDRGKPTTRRKTCPSATLSNTNLTWTDPRSNPGLRGDKPATNRLSRGTAPVSDNCALKLVRSTRKVCFIFVTQYMEGILFCC